MSIDLQHVKYNIIFVLVGDTTNQPPTLDQVEKDLATELLKQPELELNPQTEVRNEDNISKDVDSESDNVYSSSESEKVLSSDRTISDVTSSGDATSTMSEVTPENKSEEEKFDDEPPKLETEKIDIIPKSLTDQYRIVCQCGATNCRKYLF